MFAMGPAFFKAASAGYATLALTGSFASATVGAPYSSDLTISGGDGSYSNPRVTVGTLPTWATLSIVSGKLRLSGTPTGTSTTVSITVAVDSGDGQTATSAQNVAVALASALATWFSTRSSGTWFDADTTCWRDASGTVPASVGNPVRLIVSRGGYSFTAASDGTAPILRFDAALGRNYFEFTKGSAHVLIAAGSTAADWAALNNNSEAMVVARVAMGSSADPNDIYVICATCAVSAANVGFAFFWDDRSTVPLNNCLRAYAANSNTPAALDLRCDNAMSANTVHTASVTKMDATNTALAYVDGSFASPASSVLTTLSIANPQTVLMIGAANGSSYATMRLYGFAVLIGSGAAAQRAAVESAL